jgi:hypothetical protein
MIVKEVFIPVRPPSANKWAGRRNWKTYYGIKKKWGKTMALFFPAIEKKQTPTLVEITSYYCHPAKVYDEDNFIGGLKPIIDNLNQLGYLWDDTPTYLILGPIQVKTKNPNEVGIRIKITRN